MPVLVMKNVGSLDASIRLILSLAALYIGWMYTQPLFYLLALVLIWTAVTGQCYVYKLLGIDTFKAGYDRFLKKQAAEKKTAKPAKKAVKKPAKKKR